MTRAEPGASRTAGRLAAAGFEPVVAPLLAIRAIGQGEPDLDAVDALAFTSINGVTAFAALTARRDRPVFAVGDATAEAATAAGFPNVRSAGGALEDLAALLTASGLLGRMLVPGALEPAGDLAALLAGSAVEAAALPVYVAFETEAATPAAYDAVLIHSPRAGRALARLGGAEGRVAVAISQAAAQGISATPFAEIRIAAQPTENALLEALGNPARAV